MSIDTQPATDFYPTFTTLPPGGVDFINVPATPTNPFEGLVELGERDQKILTGLFVAVRAETTTALAANLGVLKKYLDDVHTKPNTTAGLLYDPEASLTLGHQQRAIINGVVQIRSGHMANEARIRLTPESQQLFATDQKYRDLRGDANLFPNDKNRHRALYLHVIYNLIGTAATRAIHTEQQEPPKTTGNTRVRTGK